MKSQKLDRCWICYLLEMIEIMSLILTNGNWAPEWLGTHIERRHL